MKTPLGRLCVIVLGLFGWISPAVAHNQTPTVSPVLSGADLPFRVSIESADFSLPKGLQSYVSAVYHGKWLLLAGRTNGLHDFNNDDDNFPPRKQNTTVYVVDPVRRTVRSRSLADPRSGLTQSQIDLLSVTSPQAYQVGATLYMTGGYGVDTATGQFSTQYLMDTEYPVILSTRSNPGNRLLFGAGAQFVPSSRLPMYDNGVLQLDRLGTAPVVVGYIVGGIQSTVPNTTQRSDSSASPHIFKVTLIPR